MSSEHTFRAPKRLTWVGSTIYPVDTLDYDLLIKLSLFILYNIFDENIRLSPALRRLIYDAFLSAAAPNRSAFISVLFYDHQAEIKENRIISIYKYVAHSNYRLRLAMNDPRSWFL